MSGNVHQDDAAKLKATAVLAAGGVVEVVQDTAADLNATVTQLEKDRTVTGTVVATQATAANLKCQATLQDGTITNKLGSVRIVGVNTAEIAVVSSGELAVVDAATIKIAAAYSATTIDKHMTTVDDVLVDGAEWLVRIFGLVISNKTAVAVTFNIERNSDDSVIIGFNLAAGQVVTIFPIKFDTGESVINYNYLTGVGATVDFLIAYGLYEPG